MSQAGHRMKRRRDGRRLPGRLFAGLAVAALLSVDGSAARTTESAKPTQSAAGRLAGWLLVAAPGMPDPRFARTVIFMLQHNDGGALGLIVNRPIAVEPASKVLKRLDGKDRSIEAGRRVRIHYGGPVQPARGFFVHSSDYAGTGTVAVTGRVSVTGPLVILRALAGGKGPTKGFLALGYAGWAPGQLENEIRRKDWVTVPPDHRLVFDGDKPSAWKRALDRRGTDL